MNVVGHYRRKLDAVLGGEGPACVVGHNHAGVRARSNKTFNRGYTTYFLHGRGAAVASPDSPKARGRAVGRVVDVRRDCFALEAAVPLHSGDGISFFGRDRELHGTVVNQIDGTALFPEKLGGIERGLRVFRNHDHAFVNQVMRSRNQRRIGVNLRLSESAAGFRLQASDEDGVTASSEIESQRVGLTGRPRPPGSRTPASQAGRQRVLRVARGSRLAADAPCAAGHTQWLAPRGWSRSCVGSAPACGLCVWSLTCTTTRLFPSETCRSWATCSIRKRRLSTVATCGRYRARSRERSGHARRKVMTTRTCIKYEMGLCPREPGDPSHRCRRAMVSGRR